MRGKRVLENEAEKGKERERERESERETVFATESQQSIPEPKCFKWITQVCHCDYMLLAGTATR